MSGNCVGKNRKFTAPPAKFYVSRRVPDFGIFSLDLDTVTFGRFSRISFGLLDGFSNWTLDSNWFPQDLVSVILFRYWTNEEQK